MVKHSMIATLLRNRKEVETANGVSRRKLAASEFSFLNFVSLSSMLLLTFAGIHSLAVNAASIFLVNRDLDASGVTVRQITVINDLDYRYNQNAAESAGQRWRRKEIGTKKELLKNTEGMLSSSGVSDGLCSWDGTWYISKSRGHPLRRLVRISPGLNHPWTKTRHAWIDD